MTTKTGESKCRCQRCGQLIKFPGDMHDTEVECPHCHKTTTLLIPETRITAAPESGGIAVNQSNLVGKICLGILAAFAVISIISWIGYEMANYTSPEQKAENLRKLMDPRPSNTAP